MGDPERLAARPTSNADDDFCAFYRDFVPKLVGFLRLQGAQLAEAADIAQDTMVQAHQRWETINHPAAWARTVASRALTRRIATVREDPSETISEGALLLTPSTNISEWEARHDILRAFDQLPPRQRQVMAWTLQGYTPAEIADELKIKPEAVRASLMKARRAISEHLALLEDSQ